MRTKMKLISICIRHKCTAHLSNSEKSLSKSEKVSSKKIVRIRKIAKTKQPSVSNLTSNFHPSVKVINTEGQKINTTHDFLENRFNRSISEKCKNNQHSEPSLGVKNIYENLDDESLWTTDNFLSSSKDANKSSERDIKAEKYVGKEEEMGGEFPKNNKGNNSNGVHGKTESEETRYNELNMQMLSRNLHKQIFGNSPRSTDIPKEMIASFKRELEEFGMRVDETSYMPDAFIELPGLEGRDLEEHFLNISRSQTEPYLKIVQELTNEIPEMPRKWIFQEGWTRYSGGNVERVEYPLEEGIIFDVEVCMKEGPLPTLATAVTKDAWYSWVTKSLVDGSSIPAESRSFTPDLLIPIESSINEHGKKLTDYQKKPKIIVGHNVSYDRARIKEQYWLNHTATRFVDTMSLHVSVSGMNSYQRSLMLANKNSPTNEDWLNVTSLNNLADVYNLYCGGKHEKVARDVFVHGSLEDVREQFDELMNYCASDVIVTHKILRKLFPLFQERFPHPVTFAGMLELGTAYLPVNSNWQRYIEESESTFADLNYEAKFSLSKRADEVCKLMHDEKFKKDLWMWDQDWSTQEYKMKAKLTKKKMTEITEKLASEEKELTDFEKYLTDGEDEIDPHEVEFKYLEKTKYHMPARKPHMPGYPAWYRKLCMKENDDDWIPGPQNISTSMKIAPKLLNLTWENYPLHHIKEHGWGFLVPYNDDPDTETNLPLKQLLSQCPLPRSSACDPDTDYAMANLRTDVQKELHKTEFWRDRKKKVKKDQEPVTFYKGSGIWCNVDIDNCCWFFKLPHKDGPNLNVGNPLAKDFLNKFSENVLAGLDSSATEVLKISKMVSYWRNNRDRIMSQLVIWLNEESLPSLMRRSGIHQSYGAIVPQVVVSGTLTRRATEATWMTASNAHVERVGSELRSMVQAPPGYNIVGADVDSQELWIASLVGDASTGIHGATPFGWMTLIGTKSKGTDMHSVTAKAVGISRDHAKVINYARIYGAGQKFAERLLKQFNPSMTESEALAKSRKMFSITKGKKVYRLKKEFVCDDLEDHQYTAWDARRIASVYGKNVEEMFEPGRWYGGSESAMFNTLERIAGNVHPVTPFLNSRLSRALEVDAEHKDKYLPTKINWVVQSGAVDFLHLMLVSMRWLMKDNARFCLSFHDEIRYIVPAKFKYNAALAMHVTNLLTRAFCASRLGMNDLPMSVSFFASVEVDTVLRKESGVDCKTPSNPHGLENGYSILPGESLDVWKALEKSGGSLGPAWNSKKKKDLKSIQSE